MLTYADVCCIVQLEQLKKLVDRKPKSTHAESLKKFGYTSALVGSDQW